MSSVDIKLRRKFDSSVTTIVNDKITAKVTGVVGASFLELKIPIESSGHNTGNDSNYRGISVLPKTVKVLHNEVFISPVVIATVATNGIDETSNIQIEISMVVEGKKPWDGPL